MRAIGWRIRKTEKEFWLSKTVESMREISGRVKWKGKASLPI